MNLLRRISLLSVLSSATLSFAANLPKTILPDNVLVCDPSASCVSKTLFGRNYKVIATPRFTVMVSLSQEGGYTRADVSVSNNTDMPLAVSPDDFRVEVVTPKPKVLLYIPPAAVVLPPPPAPAATLAPQFPNSIHRSSFLTSAPQSPGSAADTDTNPAPPLTAAEGFRAIEQMGIAMQEAADRASAEKLLSATRIAPNEVTRGRVYFESDKKSHLVNVVLPIAGLVFEFPYALKH